MNKIKCPKCGVSFTIDEASYAAIEKQVRDKIFEKEIEQRMKAAEAQFNAEKEAIRKDAEKQAIENQNKLQQERLASEKQFQQQGPGAEHQETHQEQSYHDAEICRCESCTGSKITFI